MRCAADGSGGGRGAKQGAACKSPGIGERRGLRHSGLPGSSCAASATSPGARGDKQAGWQAGIQARAWVKRRTRLAWDASRRLLKRPAAAAHLFGHSSLNGPEPVFSGS